MYGKTLRLFVLSVLSFNCIVSQSSAQETQQTSPTSKADATANNEAGPFDGPKQVYLAGVRAYQLGDYEEGIKQYKSAVLARPEPEYCNELAWAYATCPEQHLRNGWRAESLASEACKATEYKNPNYLDTYAAALAEKGGFQLAVEWQKEAIALAVNSQTFPKKELASLQLRLDLFEKHVAYSEAPQSAILEKYQTIVGSKLTKDSLAKVTYEQETELIKYLQAVPEVAYLDVKKPPVWDVLLLILTTERFDQHDRKNWAQRTSGLPDDQLDAVRTTLLEEREKPGTTEKKSPPTVTTGRRRRMTPEQQQAETAFRAAQTAYNSGDYAEGIKQLRAAYTPDNPRLQQYLAWAMATCPDEKLRSPLAVAVADKACEATDYKNPKYLDSLAAAYAQMGDFDSAVKWQTKAVELAPRSNDYSQQELPSVSYRLSLYKRKIPYREVPQTAILAKYKDIVGARLSRASLKQLDGEDKSKLIDYLKTVPELRYMAAGQTMIEEHYDLLLLMLVDDSMSHNDRYEFTQYLRQWTRDSPEKLDKFREVLLDTRERLDTNDEQFANRWNKK